MGKRVRNNVRSGLPLGVLDKADCYVNIKRKLVIPPIMLNEKNFAVNIPYSAAQLARAPCRNEERSRGISFDRCISVRIPSVSRADRLRLVVLSYYLALHFLNSDIIAARYL